MAVSKILVNYEEYMRLKEVEGKYLHLVSEKKDQVGHGSNPLVELQKTVLANEHNLDETAAPQQLVDPITVPDLPVESGASEQVKPEPSSSEPSASSPEPSASSKPSSSKPSTSHEELPEAWWFIDIPK